MSQLSALRCQLKMWALRN